MTSADPAPTGTDRRIDRLLAAYGDNHQNLINKAVHWVCVPVITWCVLAFLAALPFPDSLRIVPGVSWGLVAAIIGCLYYVTLSLPIAAGMAVVSLASLMLAAAMARWGDTPVWQVALFVFVIAWVGQILGHKLEGRRPSFLDDLRFLLIGPAWLLAAAYRLIGIRY